jgi:hypothetical protein
MTASKSFTVSIAFSRNWVNMKAVMTGLARVSGVYQYEFHAMFYRFIRQELSELVERPTIPQSLILFRLWQSVRSLPNSREVFDSDSFVAFFRLLYQAIRDDMIRVGLKASLFPRQPFQKLPTSTPRASCAFRGILLKFRSQLRVFISNFGDFFPAKFVPFRRDDNIRPSEVATDDVIGSGQSHTFLNILT